MKWGALEGFEQRSDRISLAFNRIRLTAVSRVDLAGLRGKKRDH